MTSKVSQNASMVVRLAKESKLWAHQLSALNAVHIAATQSNRTKRCIILPTGTGKSAVMLLAPYFLADGGERVKRLMIMAPSKTVAKQIEDDAKVDGKLVTLNILSSIQMQNLGIAFGSGKPNDQKLTYEWTIFNPEKFYGDARLKSGAIPSWKEWPDDAFDLVIVDEAHHYPSGYWAAVEKSFRNMLELSS